MNSSSCVITITLVSSTKYFKICCCSICENASSKLISKKNFLTNRRILENTRN